MRRLTFCSLLAAATAFGAAMPAQACTVTPTFAQDLGSNSPAAIKNGVVPAFAMRAGLLCSTGSLSLLGMNYVRGKFRSTNAFKLKSGANTINYVASADSAGSYPFGQDLTLDYYQSAVIGLGFSGDMPLYIKPSNATLPPAGVYTDQIKIDWSWSLCQGIQVGSACVAGTTISGTGQTIIDITMTVAVKAITLTTSTSTTWDPVNTIVNPKSLPGGRKRMKIDVANPDLVAADNNSIALNIAIPNRTMVALDGDGTSSTFLQMTDGTPSSALTMVYTSPSSTSDDVDFSSDGGVNWTYYPVSGNDVSQAAVTNIRLRPRGAMAAGSSASVSIPLKTK